MEWLVSERFGFGGNAIAWGMIGQGPPAALMHGSPFSSPEWRRIAPWRVFYYDMLG